MSRTKPSKRPGVMRQALLSGLAVGAAAAIAGCTLVDNDSGAFDAAAEPWIDADAEWMQGQGTPLSYGVEVPDGARLVGPVFTKLSVSGGSPT